MNLSMAVKTLIGTAALVVPVVASAASTYATGSGTLTAAATVNFEVVIPQVLYLRVGTGSTYSTGTLSTVATTDLITFSPAVGAVGNGTAVAGTGGDLTGGVETAAVVSNGGNVTLVASEAAAGLTDGSGDYIPFTQITTTAAQNTTTYTTLSAPQLNGTGSSSTITLTASAAKVVTADAKWTYKFANTATYPGGTYGGTGVNNSLVTYTATMP
jgi:hypothetical protein